MLTLPALDALKEAGSRFIALLTVELLDGAACANWILRVLRSHTDAGWCGPEPPQQASDWQAVSRLGGRPVRSLCLAASEQVVNSES
jgi:hypothetical protein